jgi:hypothetical protein
MNIESSLDQIQYFIRDQSQPYGNYIVWEVYSMELQGSESLNK